MQKPNTQLHKSTDKDKNKGKSDPFLDPKRAKKVLKEDKKFLEEIKKTAPIIVALFLTCFWLGKPFVAPPSATSTNDNTIHTPANIGQELAPEVHPVPVPNLSKNIQRNNKPDYPENSAISNVIESSSIKTKEKEAGKLNFIAFMPPIGETHWSKSPIHLLSSLVADKCKTSLNTDILGIDELNGTDIGRQLLLEYTKQKNPNLNRLTLIDFKLLELYESSSKELFTLSPENKARIQLIVRGIDAQSGTVVFEQTLEREIIRSDWAKYQRDTSNSGEENQDTYTISPAMEVLLSETANDIINILHKCLP